MQVTIDRAGRIVIPKQVRDALGLAPDTELEVTIDGAGVRLEPVGRRDRPVEERDGLPLLSLVEHVTLLDAEVRRLRENR